MYSKHTIIKITLYTVYAVVLVGVILLGFEWGSTYVENQKQASYEEQPFELKLKSAPKDVLYSEAYKTASGTDIVKYAYLAGEVSPILDEDISRRTPVSQTVVLETFKDESGKYMEKLKTVFLSKPQFYEEDGQWRQIEYATTTPEVFAMSGAIPHIKRRELAERILPGESVFAVTSTFYPDANTESTSVDGYAQGTSGVIGYLDCSNLNNDGGADDASTPHSTNVQSVYYDDNNPEGLSVGDEYNCIVTRTFVLFDTSSLPDDATISGATISMYVLYHFTQNSLSVAFSTSNPSSNTAIVQADFDNIGSTVITTSTAISSLNNSAYNVFTFNSGDLGVINRSGVTKTAFRIEDDIDGTLTPGFDTNDTVNTSSAEASGTSQDPKLEVTYTAGGFSMGMWFPF
jgi:hypothetical protein